VLKFFDVRERLRNRKQHMLLERRRLEHLLKRFGGLRIAVVGDFFLDRYWEIDAARDEPSVETGLTAYQVVGRRHSPGAAGTVAANLAALGVGRIDAVGFVGDDGEGLELERCLDRIGVARDYLLRTPERWTPCYSKPMRQGVEWNRIDIKNREKTPESVERHIIASIEELANTVPPAQLAVPPAQSVLRPELQSVDAIIVMDQVSEENCGVVTDAVRECLIRLGRERRSHCVGGTVNCAGGTRPLMYADSRERIGLFRGMLIKCNDREAVEQFGLYDGQTVTEDALQQCGRELACRTGCMVFITRGAQGQRIFDPAQPDSPAICVPAVRVEGEIDICGAGDATSAALVSSLCAGATPEEAAMIGNLAASVTIRKIGQTGTASPDEVLRAAMT